MIFLKSKDGVPFPVDQKVAMQLSIVKNFLDNNSNASQSKQSDSISSTVIPIRHIDSNTLAKILEYVETALSFTDSDEAKKKAYDSDFCSGMDKDQILKMVIAADHLDVKYLVDMLCQEIADRIVNKKVEYLREFFGIKNDFTKEEDHIRKANPSAFKGLVED